MNKIVTSIAAKKAAEAAAEAAAKAAELTEGEVVMSRKMFLLEIAVAALGGIVLGMFLSPRKTCTYKIASGNNINSEDEDDDDDDDYYDPDDDDDMDGKGKGKFIRL